MSLQVDIRPALYTSHTGQRYAIAGSVWIEVPPDTTLEELDRYMIYVPRVATKPSGTKSWEVSGSKGAKYTVRLANGSYTCTCTGFGFRRRCKHIEGVKVGSR